MRGRPLNKADHNEGKRKLVNYVRFSQFGQLQTLLGESLPMRVGAELDLPSGSLGLQTQTHTHGSPHVFVVFVVAPRVKAGP